MTSNLKDTNIFSLPMLQQVIDYIEDRLFEKLTPIIVFLLLRYYEQITIPKNVYLCYDDTEGMENAEVKRTSHKYYWNEV